MKLALAATLAVAMPASAQFAYPAKGQSPEQQKKDEAACASWATQQTGFDPSKPPPAPAAQRGANRRAARDQQAAATEQVQAGNEAYGKARGACLEGKGYTVK